jgi:hypothetical protein
MDVWENALDDLNILQTGAGALIYDIEALGFLKQEASRFFAVEQFTVSTFGSNVFKPTVVYRHIANGITEPSIVCQRDILEQTAGDSAILQANHSMLIAGNFVELAVFYIGVGHGESFNVDKLAVDDGFIFNGDRTAVLECRAGDCLRRGDGDLGITFENVVLQGFERLVNDEGGSVTHGMASFVWYGISVRL